MELNCAVGGTDEVAQDGNVWTIDTDAASVDGEAKLFGLFEIHTGVVEFGQAKTLGGKHAIQTRRVNRTGRTMAAPRASSYFVELLPIAFLPSGHFQESLLLTTIFLLPWMR